MADEHSFKCEACGQNFDMISSVFRSVIHDHDSARKMVKNFCIAGEVRHVSTNKPAFVCQRCTEKLVSAMAAGRNLEQL